MSQKRILLNGVARFTVLLLTALISGLAPAYVLAAPPSAPAAQATCPCSIWDDATTPGQAAVSDSNAIEVGVKFRSSVDGYIVGLRFYKGSQNTGTHVGHLWAGDGTLLAEATFVGETALGWQEVAIDPPVAIISNTTYVASYHSEVGHYAFDGAYFASSGVDSPPLRALANGEDGPNGVYLYGVSGFPTQTYNASNYWVDVVFDTTVGPDTTPPAVSSVSPAEGMSGIEIDADVTARFSEPVDPATVGVDTFELRDASNDLVAAAVTYSAAARTATLDPAAPLAYSSVYTATVRGGEAGPHVADLAGNALPADFVWSFTTEAPPPPPPDEGPGGPILVVAHAANPFGRYYAEILRAEGLNAFTVTDVSTVSSQTLTSYDVVILGEMPLTTAQATMFSDWVVDGGNLIAMRPDGQLAGLLGLADAASTLSDAYLLVDTATGPGAGIVGETIQFHGTADLYTLSGATGLATLYADATTATSHPAVTLRTVGSSGGQAAAFAYDLARSIVYTRQGNPAWVGQERDGVSPLRSDDMFYGPASSDPQPDWIDLDKVAIPQADEQQRLLANLILHMNLDRKPLPRFWYFPHGLKAVVIMTGDDHGNGGTAGRFDDHISDSPPGCSVEDWECIRASSYIYVSTPLTDEQAAAYTAQGFEVALHVNTGCANYTATTLESFYANQLAAFGAKYASIPSPSSHRTHCIAWSGWTIQPQVEFDHGIRLDTNYYYWPPSWVANRPGLFTGSGMPMRFADLDGTMIDVYQATTQMTDESGQSYPFTIDALLDRALGSQGYYGAFTANMHTDSASHAGSDAIVASAQVRGVPIVSGRQMMQWLDGRNSSSFDALDWDGNTLSFTVTVGAGANGLRAIVPTNSAVGTLTGITRDGSPVAYTTETIKGVEYATLAAVAGAHEATYEVDTTAPIIWGVIAVPGTGGSAMVAWNTDELSDSRVDYGESPTPLMLTAVDGGLVTSHGVTLTGLSPNTTYYYRVSSTDAVGNPAAHPATGDPPASFTTPSDSFVDTTVADFSAGSPDANTYVGETDDGEVILAPTVRAEFSGAVLPAGWLATPWGGGGTATVSDGVLTLDGARAGTDDLYGPGRALEFVATFAAAANQHVGFGLTYSESPWAIFSTMAGAGLYARTNDDGAMTNTLIPGSWLGAPHHYRIEWNGDSVDFIVDGDPVASHPVTIIDPMRPLANDYLVGGDNLPVDWMRMSPYPSSGVFVSRIFDAGRPAMWGHLSWTSDAPAGTTLTLSVRTGDTPVPDGTWTAFSELPGSGAPIGGSTRYVQYRAELATTDADRTPVLQEVVIGYNLGPDTTPPTIEGRFPAPDATDVPLDSDVVVQFSEPMSTTTVAASTFWLRDVETGDEVPATVSCVGTAATLDPIDPLARNRAYQAIVAGSVVDLSGNPLGEDDTWVFGTARLGDLSDTTVADFGAGSPGADTHVAQAGDGEVILTPAVGAEFSGLALPAGWSSAAWRSGGTASVSDGVLTVDGARAGTEDLYGSGRALEFVGTFAAASYQHIGFGLTYTEAPWAMFSTGSSGTGLQARTYVGGVMTDTPIPGDWLGAPHWYRVEWNADSVDFYIDGNPVASRPVSIADPMRPLISDYTVGGGSLSVDWLRMSPYPALGTFVSRVFDAGEDVDWSSLGVTVDEPTGTAVGFETRTAVDGVDWSDWEPVDGGAIASPVGRYIQYRAMLSTSDPMVTPVVEEVILTYATLPTIAVTKSAEPTSVAEPGDDVTFTVSVTNTSAGTVTLTSLVDTVHGGLAGQGSCSLPQEVALGGLYGCAFTATVSGNAGESETDLVVARAFDDAGNLAEASASATVTVTDVLPVIDVAKSADPAILDEPGGTVGFTVVVTNTSVETVTLTSLVDDPYGDLADLSNPVILNSTCATGGAIDPNGGTYVCAFQVELSGAPGVYTDTVSATAEDDEGNEAGDEARAAVTIADVLPSIAVTKVADPTQVPEPGGTVTFTVRVTNTGQVESITVITLTDTVYGDLTLVPGSTCALPQDLEPGAAYECAFTAAVSGNAGDIETDVVTATASDDEGNLASNDDDATVTVEDVLPGIAVTKTADPTVIRSGDLVEFTIRVDNRSVEPVTLVNLDDTVFGDLVAECGLPTEIAVGGLFECAISRTIGADHTNTVTATAVDDDGNAATDSAGARVDVVGPAIRVIKEASVASIRVGQTVTYTYRVENAGDVALSDVRANDDRLGTIALGRTALGAGEATTATAAYVVAESDLPGPLINTVTVTGTPPVGADVTNWDLTSVDVKPAIWNVYLPVAVRRAAGPAPDLVVESIQVGGGVVRVVIKNQGTAPVEAVDAFWVDLYVDPDPVPTGVNQTWDSLCSEGIAWGVEPPALPLEPGGAITLTLGDDYYWEGYSNFGGSLPVGTPIYVQVDSADVGTACGAVLEGHEIVGGPYNNIGGPAYPGLSGLGGGPAEVERFPVGDPPSASSRWLPPRP